MSSKKNDSNLVFILGSHRTGTKLLSNFFNDEFEGVKSVHQYNLLRFNNIVSNLFIANIISERSFIKYLKKYWFKNLSKQTNFIAYIESNGFNFLSAYYAKKEFEKVKIIHVVRDPRSYIYSYINWIENRWQSKLINKIPFWHVTGYNAKLLTYNQWKAYSTEEKIAWYWAYKNKFINEKYSSDNYFLLKFEDLIDEKKRETTIRNVLKFLGLDYSPRLINYFDVKQNESKKTIGAKWTDWDKRLSLNVNEICNQGMKKYGYGNEELWLEKLRQ